MKIYIPEYESLQRENILVFFSWLVKMSSRLISYSD